MANNELAVIAASGDTKVLRSDDLGGVHVQGTIVWEGRETPVSPSGGATRHTVTGVATALDSPTAAVSFARVRVYEASGPANPDSRLYYRSDGTDPLADGSNAFGYLLHGELIQVKLLTPTNFKMISDGTGSFEVYVEWLAIPSV